MARIIRASLVLMLLLVTACRFGAARREALFRFAVSAILNAASAAEQPAIAEPTRPAMAVQEAAVDPPAAPAATRRARTECPSLRVSAISIPAAELRPAVEAAGPLFGPVAVSLERRISMARVQIDRNEMRRVVREAQSARCRDAARVRAEALVWELRAAHLILSADDATACPVDPNASMAFPASATEIESLQTVGG